MIAVFVVFYVLAIWLVYVKVKIKPNPINIAVAASVGFLAVGFIVVLWQFSAPASKSMVVSRYTVPIVPQVAGPIAKIYAQPNVPLKEGQDKLFEIQKTPFQFTVNQRSATLEAAKQTVEQLIASVAGADAAIKVAIANAAAAQAQYESAKQSEEAIASSIGAVQLEKYKQEQIAADASVEQAEAAKQSTTAALAAAKSTVESSKASLDSAEFDLQQCTVYAPADGFVTNWQAREGTMASSLPLAPMGTFIDTSEARIVAMFGQNVVENMKPRNLAEIAFKTRPGEIFTGKVVAIIQASGDGQFTTSGKLISASSMNPTGQFAVTLQVDDESFAQSLAMGTTGTATVYTDGGKPLHVISKVTIRVKTWMNYLNLF